MILPAFLFRWILEAVIHQDTETIFQAFYCSNSMSQTSLIDVVNETEVARDACGEQEVKVWFFEVDAAQANYCGENV